MVASTLETPGKISFDSLKALRAELTRQSKNKERLREFQGTIDEALKNGDKKGILEFTENEWKNMITDENLPPLEPVKKKLKDKIETIQPIEGQTSFTSGIKDMKQKVEGLADSAKEKMEEIKAKIENLKKYTQPALWFMGIGLGLEIWGYKIANWLSGLFGKKGKYDDKIKVAEMEKEFLENPEAALEKYGEEAKKMVEGKGEEKIEEKEEGDEEEGLLEKVGPIAALGGAGLGIFTLLKNKLPASISSKFPDGIDQKTFLGKISQNRALKLFGVSGIALFGIGKLHEYIESNSATIGEIPTDEEGKKTWWKTAIEKAGIGTKEGAEEVWAILNGEKLDEYLTEKEDPEEMEKKGLVRLEEHKTIQAAKKQILLLEKRCEKIYTEHSDAFNSAGSLGLILKPGMFVGAASKGIALMLTILKYASPGLIIPAGLVVGLTGNGIEALKHVQVPADLGPEDIKDLLNIPEITEFLESHAPDFSEVIDYDKIAKEISTLEEKIKEFNTKDFLREIAGTAAEKLIQSEQEKINDTNDRGIVTLIKTLEIQEIKTEKKMYSELLGTKESPGILRRLHTKLSNEEALTESDIRLMMEAAEGTNLSIFPRDESKSGRTIQYVFSDEIGFPINLCINPTIEYAEQFETAHDFIVNEYDLNAANVLGKFGSELRGTLSELTESIKTNNENSGTLLEAGFKNGLSIVTFGLETFFVDYLGNKYFLGPWNLVQSAFLKMDNPEDKLEMQEGLVEYGQGLAPVFVITATKNLLTGHGFFGFKNRGLINGIFKNSIVQSITYPIEIIGKGTQGAKIATKYIFNRVFAGNYKDIFSDPKNEIKAYYYSIAHRLKSLKSTIPVETLREIGGKHANLSKLEEARKLLYQAKQSYMRSGDIGEAIKILEDGPGKFEHLTVGGTLSNNQIKTLLDRVEKEIEEQKKTLSYLEKGIREKFPQIIANRNDSIENQQKRFNIKTEEGKKQAEEAFEDSKKEIEAMEEKRTTIEAELSEAEKAHTATPGDTLLKQDVVKKRKAHAVMVTDYNDKHRDLSEIREAMGELLHGRKPKIHLTEAHAKSVKGLRGSAKILGILALTVGAGFGIEKIAEYIHGDSHENKSSAEGSEENDDKYYGFKKETDKGVDVEKDKEKNEYTCDTPEEFNKRIEEIETQYIESTNKFLDPEWVSNISSDERERRIQEAADGHMIRVGVIKSLISANKKMMECFWNKTFIDEENGEEIIPSDIREQGVKAFMFIHRKNGKLTLDYMNHQDMKNVLYILYDQNHKNWPEKNMGSGVTNAGGIALRIAPFTGSYMDGQDAWQSFSRGNMGDGLWSTAWCLGGFVLDIGGAVSAGGSTAAGIGLRTAKAGAKAALHNGIQMGVQFGQALARVPRSESVSIDSL